MDRDPLEEVRNNNMKKIILLVTALALFGAVSLRAADDPKPAKPAAKGKPSAEDLKKYDKNGDGKLDKEEKAAMKADTRAEKAKANPEKKKDK